MKFIQGEFNFKRFIVRDSSTHSIWTSVIIQKKEEILC